MTYLSKGLLMWLPMDNGVTVSHCGKLHKLSQPMAELWLAGQLRPGETENLRDIASLHLLSELGIVERTNQDSEAGVFRILTNCAICVTRTKPGIAFLNSRE